jgi:hypothetical protein
MIGQDQKVFKITAGGTQHVLNKTGFVTAVIASVVTPGTLAITIQDQAPTAPNKLLPPFDLTPPGAGTGIMVRTWEAPQPVRMQNGIDIVTAAGGTGEVYLWIFFSFEPDPQ